VKLNITFEEKAYIFESRQELIPKDWEDLYRYISEKDSGYTVMVLGNVDTGKTGLITYLANKLFFDGKKVAIVDADTGQSDIGPPATIGLGKISKPIIHLSQAELLDAFFVGNVTPAGVLDRSITGTYRMVQKGKHLGYDVILIDTTGWIGDRWGRELKTLKIMTVNPDLIVFIEKERGELSHIEKTIIGLSFDTYHVSAPPELRARTREERRTIRVEMFQKEFNGASEVVLSLEDLGIEYGFLGTGGEPKEETLLILRRYFGENMPYVEESQDSLVIYSEERISAGVLQELKYALNKREVINIIKEDLFHVLVCLTDNQGTYLGLGIVLDFDPKERKLTILTKANSARISNIQIGHIRVSPDGREEEKFNPWRI